MKQYLPMKPIKPGYKVSCRADSKTGYFLQFEVYEGKKYIATSQPKPWRACHA